VHINQWPPYVYFPMVFILIIILGYAITTGRVRKDPYIYTAMEISFLVSMFCAGIQKALRTYWNTFEGTAEIFGIGLLITGAIGIFFGFVGTFKYGNERKKKTAKWALVYLAAVAIFIGLLFLLKHLGYIGPGK